MTQAFMRMKYSAQDNKDRVFNNLLHQLNPDFLKRAYHSLDGHKAKGRDGITKAEYGKDLDNNIMRLHQSLHDMAYRPSPSRQVLIPKENGKMRSLAISNLEDKIIQKAVSDILIALYEPLFVHESLGFRPKRGCHTAISTLYRSLGNNHLPYIVDIDIEKFFDTINHDLLIDFLKKRISDSRFLRTIWKLLKPGIVSVDGDMVPNTIGSPQGSIASPVLANIFLHYVLDLWFQEEFGKQGSKMVRYADDVIFGFRRKKQAQDFLEACRARLLQFGLKLNESKTKIIDFNQKKHETFNFLGFSFFWGKDKAGHSLLKLKTKAEKLRKAIQTFKLWIKENRNRKKLPVLWNEAKTFLRGHYAYFGVSYNQKVWAYHTICKQAFFKWINRRSQKHSMSWQRFNRRLANNPWPTPYGAYTLDLTQGTLAYDY